MQNKFYKTIKYDLSYGMRVNKLKFLLILFLFISLDIVFFTDVSRLHFSSIIDDKATITDCWISCFRGINIYIPSPDKPFPIPIVWLMIQAAILFTVFSYPTQDIHSHGIQVLTRTKSRTLWWLSKCCWNIITVILCYLIAFASICCFTLCFGNFSFTPNYTINQYINEISLNSSITPEFFIMIFLLPILTSITISLFQMTLSFIFSPIISYFIVMCYIIASAYYYSPILIGNFSMIMRNQFLDPRGSNTYIAIIINICLLIVISLIGIVYFRRYDIIKKS